MLDHIFTFLSHPLHIHVRRAAVHSMATGYCLYSRVVAGNSHHCNALNA